MIFPIKVQANGATIGIDGILAVITVAKLIVKCYSIDTGITCPRFLGQNVNKLELVLFVVALYLDFKASVVIYVVGIFVVISSPAYPSGAPFGTIIYYHACKY